MIVKDAHYYRPRFTTNLTADAAYAVEGLDRLLRLAAFEGRFRAYLKRSVAWGTSDIYRARHFYYQLAANRRVLR